MVTGCGGWREVVGGIQRTFPGETRAESDQLNRDESLATSCFDLQAILLPVRLRIGGVTTGPGGLRRRERQTEGRR